MKKINILLVEDEEAVASFLKTELVLEGYGVTHLTGGEQVLKAFVKRPFDWDLILLDWMLPELSGLEVCRRIRKFSPIPILMMTARDYVSDKVAALDSGADDYVTKPFEIEELLARIRVIVRRQSKEMGEVVEIAGLKINLLKRSVEKQGQFIDLTPKEFDLLVALARHKDKVLTRDQLLNEVWGYEYDGQTNIIDVYIRYLRGKLDSPLIQTVRGVGYALKEKDDE